LETEQTPTADSDQNLRPVTSRKPRRWARPELKPLLIWLGISFVLPVPILLALRIPLNPVGAVFTVQTELPVKAIVAFAVLLGTWIVSRMEKRPLDDFGIPPRQAFGRRFWEGLAWGFAMLSAILLVLRASGHFRIDSVDLTGGAVFRYAFCWGLVFLAVAINEEFAFRGYLLFSFAKRLSFWPAAMILSVSFGTAHLFNPGETPVGILQVVVIGMIFCLTLRRTGNLWFAVGFHAAWDWAETFFYGTPNSGLLGVGRFLNTSFQGSNWITGGSAGPEGSVIALFALLLCALLIHFRFPQAVYPDRPI
jgi:membrane protease YdiL (CAAX protease family)